MSVTVLSACSSQKPHTSASSAPEIGQLPENPPGPGGPGGPGGPPNFREHTVVQSSGSPDLLPATTAPITDSQASSAVEGEWRMLESNGISEHNTGPFPNDGNPNSISEQSHSYRIPATPELASEITEGNPFVFGLAVNGVPFDPGAREFYQGNPRLGWQYDALSGAVPLGLDENHAHVQPTGTYHYHGMPSLLLETLNVTAEAHSPLIGWAADGFPIYAQYGYQNSESADSDIVVMTSSYQLKSGNRPGGEEPDGVYDGTFVRDYTYVAGTGSLDECNGQITVTPEFPEGTYAYFLTSEFPFVPRCFKGTPSQDFAKGRPPG